jgi:hypothetical protein
MIDRHSAIDQHGRYFISKTGDRRDDGLLFSIDHRGISLSSNRQRK